MVRDKVRARVISRGWVLAMILKHMIETKVSSWSRG